MPLKFQVQLKIRKPVPEVFDAVANPEKLSGYFTRSASGPLVTGVTVKWSFPEFPGEHDVQVIEVVKNERIVLEWEATEGGYLTRTEMLFKAIDAQNTMVQITESGWRDNPQGLESSYGNCSGWTHMLCCLKGYVEYGINLREGGSF
ncbi:MAG: hypothetical protein GMKNLPBB_02804 [Myxococcota bacterium]|nr:hypothetical protein [Myxococcota bacterium]